VTTAGALTNAAKPRGDQAILLSVTHPANRMGDMVLDDSVAVQLERIIKEQHMLSKIKEYGLSPRRS
jgi:hypothetical protein